MKYYSVAEIAEKWGLSERSVRNYCSNNKILGAYLIGKTWQIPENASRPDRTNSNKRKLLEVLKFECQNKISSGIYHKVQVDLAYNSNHIEGSTLTHDQTRYIYETNTLGLDGGIVNVNDIIETTNHFKCVDYIIDSATFALSERIIKKIHSILKGGTVDEGCYIVGDYKGLPNEVGGKQTTPPERVAEEMTNLIEAYNFKKKKTFDEILEFHVRFEQIHPFQDGNGRVGRLILFRECLRNNLVPFIISDDMKLYYYRGLREWKVERGYLRDTCLAAQDRFKEYLKYFRIDE